MVLREFTVVVVVVVVVILTGTMLCVWISQFDFTDLYMIIRLINVIVNQ